MYREIDIDRVLLGRRASAPADMRIPPLKIKSMLASIPPKSRMLVPIWAVRPIPAEPILISKG